MEGKRSQWRMFGDRVIYNDPRPRELARGQHGCHSPRTDGPDGHESQQVAMAYARRPLIGRYSELIKRAEIGHEHAHEGWHTAVSIMRYNGVPIQDIATP